MDTTEYFKRYYPEIWELIRKLKNNEKLSKIDEWNLNEIIKTCGWNREDVIDDLINIHIPPIKFEKKYWQLFNKYYDEAKELKNRGDLPQAGEKLWGSIIALIKNYSVKYGIYVPHWDYEQLWNVIYKYNYV